MSEAILSDIEKFLAKKNKKSIVLFKTANILDGTANCTIVRRRKVTAYINEQISLGGFIVSNYWIRGTPSRNTIYKATHLGALSVDERKALEHEQNKRQEMN